MTSKSLSATAGVFLICMAAASCSRNTCCNIPAVPPQHGRLLLSLKHNGTALPDTILDKVVLRYDNKDMTITNPNHDPDKPSNFLYDESYLLQQVRNGAYKPIPGLLMSRIVPEVIARSGIKEFYLSYPDGSTDTLIMEMDIIPEEQTGAERCHCIYPFRSISRHGVPMPEDTDAEKLGDVGGNPVFLIEK